ncbi:MFS transporter [Thermomonospora cellulosilytica]|uniref:MFS family permease n=1 Tax=Thermomonospora cellulosilytica TaxID=1411118 RepID=A0A7W3R7V8_9ACTN|nr:MFS transporter [Thermomonospora cellulosilytica]MBA9002745.1 MFS family permease [Thermomonospora cellulosilytica]
MSAATVPAMPAVPAAPTRQARMARAAVAALFLTNGAVFFNVVPRYPQIKADLGLSNAVLGTALAGYPIGALLAGLLAGAAIRRFRSARVAAFGIVVTTVATLVIPVAPNWVALGGALFVVGALDSVVDVAQNAHGLRVQRLYGRSIVNSLHGVWSIGAVLGGLMGSAAVGLRLPLSVHLSISAVLFSGIALVAYRFLLPGPEDAERLAEAQDLAAADGHPAAPPARHGGRRSFTGPAVRMLAVPSIATALAGFALAGLGVATLVPAAMHTADELPGLPDGTGLTIVSWLLRGGLLLSPPLVGFVADLTSLRVGLLSVVLAGAITVVLARVLVNRAPT